MTQTLFGLATENSPSGNPPGAPLAGSACVPVEDENPIHAREILAREILVVPLQHEGPVRAVIQEIVQAAQATGHEVPPHFSFGAGQVFYREEGPEEVRLSGFCPTAPDRASPAQTWTRWSTPTLPRLTQKLDGAIEPDPADGGRAHLSALVIHDPKAKGRLAVAFVWDLRANVPEAMLQAMRHLPLPPPPPRNEPLTVMSAAHYQGLREALYKKSFEQREGIPWPTALLEKGNHRGQAQLRPAAIDAQPLLPPEEVEKWAQIMWRQREELSDLDADALDALSTIWLAQARSPQDDAVADVDDLLALRGLKPKQRGQGRRGGYEPEQRTEMLKALSHIQNLWINMAEVEVYQDDGKSKRRRKPTRQAIQSRAFVITDRMGQLRLDGYMDVQKFIFRPGKVFAHFLFGPGRQTALLSAKALQYDPYRRAWEKRLTRYFSYQWRCKAYTGNYLQPYRVVTLLEAAGEEPNPRRLSPQREHLEGTLDTIQGDGVIGIWQYEHLDEDWPRSTMLIEPPGDVRERYRHLELHEEPKRKALPAPDTLGGRIKRRRQEMGLMQLQAAEQIGISPAYLSQLEGDKRGKKSSPETRKRIEKWLTGTEK